MTSVSLDTHPDRTERFWDGDVGTEAPDRSRGAGFFESLGSLYLYKTVPGHAGQATATESGFSKGQGRGAAYTEPAGIFDFEQALNSAAAIEDVSKLLAMAGMRKSAERLQVLKFCEKDMEEGDKPLCLDPVLNYAEFICLFGGFGEPALAVSPDGILGASWKFEDGRYLKLRFFPDDRIIYAAILPGTEPGNPERMYGHGCRSDVMRALRARGLDG